MVSLTQITLYRTSTRLLLFAFPVLCLLCVNVQLECKLLDLQNQYSVKVSEKDALQVKCEEITTQLGRAEVLTTSLGDEQVRICMVLREPYFHLPQ